MERFNRYSLDCWGGGWRAINRFFQHLRPSTCDSRTKDRYRLRYVWKKVGKLFHGIRKLPIFGKLDWPTDRVLVWGSGPGKPAAQFTCLLTWHVRVLSWSCLSSVCWEFKTQQYETDIRPVAYFYNVGTYLNISLSFDYVNCDSLFSKMSKIWCSHSGEDEDVLWVMAPCGLVGRYERFGELHPWRWRQCFSETSVFVCMSTRHNLEGEHRQWTE